MFAIIGIVIVFGCIVAGYLMEHGNLKVLLQPAELVIILGAAIGTVLIANPLHILKKLAGGVAATFGGSPFNKERYMDSLKLMYELFSRARKEGSDGTGSRQRQSGAERHFFKIPQISEGSPCSGVCMRCVAHGGLGRN